VFEIFSGSCTFSKKLALAGTASHAVDTSLSPKVDLLVPVVQRRLLQEISSGPVLAVWFDFPCTTWSRARRADGRGPGPLRDDGDGLHGLPDLSAKDKAKVREGNLLLQGTCKLA
jgi:hypothetical protein